MKQLLILDTLFLVELSTRDYSDRDKMSEFSNCMNHVFKIHCTKEEFKWLSSIRMNRKIDRIIGYAEGDYRDMRGVITKVMGLSNHPTHTIAMVTISVFNYRRNEDTLAVIREFKLKSLEI